MHKETILAESSHTVGHRPLLSDEARHSFLTLFVLWLIVASVFGYVHERTLDDQMALSRLDLLHALVFKHTFVVDAYCTNTVDLAAAQGHYYCDKAPGVVFLALPAFYTSSKILSWFGVPPESPQGWFCSGWLSVAGSIGVLSALGAVCLLLWLQGFMPARCALLCTLVVSFGTVMFPYATMMFSHGLVAGLLSMALWFLRLGHEAVPSTATGERPRYLRDLAGGAACGMAIACEYDAALMAGGILAVVFASSFQRGCRMMLGAVPPLLLIPIYNWACLGNPFSLPYGHEAVLTQMHSGFYGIHAPDPGNLFHLLFSPQRGLFFWTPFLFLAFPGYMSLYARSRPLYWLCYCGPMLHSVVLSGFYNVSAGFTLGSRYLAPVLPLLILPAGIAAAKARWASALLAGFSVAAISIATLVDVQLPSGTDNPLFHFYIPQFLAGNFTVNLGEIMGLSRPLSILPLFGVVSTGVWYVWRQAGKLKPRT